MSSTPQEILAEFDALRARCEKYEAALDAATIYIHCSDPDGIRYGDETPYQSCRKCDACKLLDRIEALSEDKK